MLNIYTGVKPAVREFVRLITVRWTKNGRLAMGFPWSVFELGDKWSNDVTVLAIVGLHFSAQKGLSPRTEPGKASCVGPGS